MRRMGMKTKKADMGTIMVTAGMFLMECFGTVMLFCGIMDIQIL